ARYLPGTGKQSEYSRDKSVSERFPGYFNPRYRIYRGPEPVLGRIPAVHNPDRPGREYRGRHVPRASGQDRKAYDAWLERSEQLHVFQADPKQYFEPGERTPLEGGIRIGSAAP